MNGPYAHNHMHESYDKHTLVLEAVRKAVVPDMTLMVDVQYLFPDAATCLSVVKDWGQFNPYFLETPIWSDSVTEMAKLVRAAPTDGSAAHGLCKTSPTGHNQEAE